MHVGGFWRNTSAGRPASNCQCITMNVVYLTHNFFQCLRILLTSKLHKWSKMACFASLVEAWAYLLRNSPVVLETRSGAMQAPAVIISMKANISMLQLECMLTFSHVAFVSPLSSLWAFKIKLSCHNSIIGIAVHLDCRVLIHISRPFVLKSSTLKHFWVCFSIAAPVIVLFLATKREAFAGSCSLNQRTQGPK